MIARSLILLGVLTMLFSCNSASETNSSYSLSDPLASSMVSSLYSNLQVLSAKHV